MNPNVVMGYPLVKQTVENSIGGFSDDEKKFFDDIFRTTLYAVDFSVGGFATDEQGRQMPVTPGSYESMRIAAEVNFATGVVMAAKNAILLTRGAAHV